MVDSSQDSPMDVGCQDSPMVGSWYNSPMVGGSRRAGRALRRRSQRQLFCNILSINALITVATTPNIEMSVWLLCSCEAAINNARIVAATIIYCSEANRLIWKNEGCLEPDVDVKVKLKWGWSLNAAQTEYTSGRRLLECLPGKIKQECPNNNAAHRSITNDKKIPLIMEAVSPFKLLTRLLHCLNCWQCL